MENDFELALPPSVSHGMLGVCAVPGELRALDAARLMKSNGTTAVIITRETRAGSRVRGLFTERDVITRLICAAKPLASTFVEEVMTSDPRCIRPRSQPLEALRVMYEGRFRHLPIVTSGGILVGMIDIVKLVDEMVCFEDDPAEQASSGRGTALSWVTSRFSSLLKSAASPRTPTRVRLRRTLVDLDADRSQAVVSVEPSDTVLNVCQLMRRHRVSAVLVCDGAALEGILTERDVYAAQEGTGTAGRPLIQPHPRPLAASAAWSAPSWTPPLCPPPRS